MPAYDTLRVPRMRFFQLCGLVLVSVLSFSGPSLAQVFKPETSEVQPAAALIDPPAALRTHPLFTASACKLLLNGCKKSGWVHWLM